MSEAKKNVNLHLTLEPTCTYVNIPAQNRARWIRNLTSINILMDISTVICASKWWEIKCSIFENLSKFIHHPKKIEHI